MLTSEEVLLQTQNWIEKIVVGLNFCPFAKRAVLRNSIRYVVSTKSNLKAVLLELIEEFKQLDADETIETTIIIYPNLFEDFQDYLDLVNMGESFIEQLDYEGIYQLASFHPNYCFAGTAAADASNYTNRSPYPMLHLLREARLEAVLAHYNEPKSIPDRNIAFARKKGKDVLEKLLLSCYRI